MKVAPLHGRRLWFPVALNVWPILLLVSQKLLLPIGLVFASIGSRKTRQDVLVAIFVVGLTGLLLGVQRPNEYAVAHFAGYALFMLAVPLINDGLRASRTGLIRWLSIVSVLNAIFGIIFFVFEIDMTIFRGLNKIIDSEGVTTRIYFESASLLAVFSLASVRNKWIRRGGIVITAIYALFLAKSVLVVLLYAVNAVAYRVMRAPVSQRILLGVAFLLLMLVGPVAVALLRPDFMLSVGFKLLQIDLIFSDFGSPLVGRGWGYVIDAIATSEDQPYQVEMQFPMLLLQMGVPAFFVYVIGMVYQIRSISGCGGVFYFRAGLYFLVGFSNPWMFLPSWYLTVALMFAALDRRGSK